MHHPPPYQRKDIVKFPPGNRFHLLMGHNTRLLRVHSYTKCWGLFSDRFFQSRTHLRIVQRAPYFPTVNRFWFPVLNNRAICLDSQFLHGMLIVFPTPFAWFHLTSISDFPYVPHTPSADFLPTSACDVWRRPKNTFQHTVVQLLRPMNHQSWRPHVSNVVLVLSGRPLYDYRNQTKYHTFYRPALNPPHW